MYTRVAYGAVICDESESSVKRSGDRAINSVTILTFISATQGVVFGWRHFATPSVVLPALSSEIPADATLHQPINLKCYRFGAGWEYNVAYI